MPSFLNFLAARSTALTDLPIRAATSDNVMVGCFHSNSSMAFTVLLLEATIVFDAGLVFTGVLPCGGFFTSVLLSGGFLTSIFTGVLLSGGFLTSIFTGICHISCFLTAILPCISFLTRVLTSIYHVTLFYLAFCNISAISLAFYSVAAALTVFLTDFFTSVFPSVLPCGRVFTGVVWWLGC